MNSYLGCFVQFRYLKLLLTKLMLTYKDLIMKRFFYLNVIALVAACMMGCSDFSKSNKTKKPPNILFIVTDDQGA